MDNRAYDHDMDIRGNQNKVKSKHLKDQLMQGFLSIRLAVGKNFSIKGETRLSL